MTTSINLEIIIQFEIIKTTKFLRTLSNLSYQNALGTPQDKIELFFLLLALKKYHQALLQIKQIPFSKIYKKELYRHFKNSSYFKTLKLNDDRSPNTVATILNAEQYLAQVTNASNRLDLKVELDAYLLNQNNVDANLKFYPVTYLVAPIRKTFPTGFDWDYGDLKPTVALKNYLRNFQLLSFDKTQSYEKIRKLIAELPLNFEEYFNTLKNQELYSDEIKKLAYKLIYAENQTIFPQYKGSDAEILRALLLCLLKLRASLDEYKIPDFNSNPDISKWHKFLRNIHDSDSRKTLTTLTINNNHTNYLFDEKPQVDEVAVQLCENIALSDTLTDYTKIEQIQNKAAIFRSIPKSYPKNYENATKKSFESYLEDQQVASNKKIVSYHLTKTKEETIQSIKMEVITLSNGLEDHAKSILKIINKQPLPHDLALHLLRQHGKSAIKASLDDVLKAIIDQNFGASIKKLNSTLDYEDITSLKKTVITYLRDYTNKKILEKGLERLLSSDDEIVQEGINILAQKRAFVINDHTLFMLYFEYKSNLRLREKQANLINKCYQAILNGQRGVAFQLMSGEGKTSAILSSLAKILADKKLVCILSHHSQLASLSSSFATYQIDRFGDNVVLVDATALELSSEKGLKKVWDRICFAEKNKFPLLMKSTFPQLLLGLFQKHSLNYIAKQTNGQICSGLAKIIRKLQTDGISLIDECDSSLSVNTEVHLPVNGAEQIKGDESKLIAAIYTFLIEGDVAKILSNKQHKIAANYPDEILPQLASQMAEKFCHQYSSLLPYAKPIQRLLANQISAEDEAIALSEKPLPEGLSVDSTENIALLKDLYSFQASSDASCNRAFEMIALAKHVLNDIMPAALAKSYNRHYGPLLTDEKGEIVPYLGVGTPAPTKFGDPYLALALSLQASLYGKIGAAELNFLAKELFEAAKLYSTHERKSLAETAEIKLFKDLTGLDLAEFMQNQKLAKTALEFINDENHLVRRLNFRLETAPYSVKYYPNEVCITPNHLSWVFPQSIACSGTFYNRSSYSTDYETILKDDGTEGAILNRLESARLQQIPDESLESLLKVILNDKNCSRVHAIIDSGGFLKEFSNQKLAEQILKSLKHIEGVLFLNRNDEFCILKGGSKIVTLQNTSLAEINNHITLDKLFVLFDELRSTGTDIPLKSNAVCYQTIDSKMPLRTLLQGALRARNLFQSQEIVLNTTTTFDSLHDLLFQLQSNEAVSSADQTLKSIQNQQDIESKINYINKALQHPLDISILREHQKLLYTTKNFSNYADWLKIGKTYVNTEEWLPKDLDQSLIQKLPDTIAMQGSTSTLEIEMAQELEVETEIQTELTLEQEIARQYSRHQSKLRTYVDEDKWPTVITLDLLLDYSLSIESLLKEHAGGMFTLKFIKSFPTNLRITKNLAIVSNQPRISIFDEKFKQSHHLLIYNTVDNHTAGFLLSKHDATSLKAAIIQTEQKRQIYVTDLDGNVMAGDANSTHWQQYSHGKELQTMLWFANFFNGNFGYLHKHKDLSQDYFSIDPDLFLKFTLLKNYSKKHQFSNIISSELATNSHKILKNSKKVNCSYRAEELALAGRSLKLLPLADISKLAPERVNGLNRFQVPHLATKEQIRNLDSEHIPFISRSLINNLTKEQAIYISELQLPFLQAEELINTLPVEKLQLLSNSQLSKVSDFDKLLNLPIESLTRFLSSPSSQQLLTHLHSLKNIKSLNSKLLPYFSNQQLLSLDKDYYEDKISHLSPKQFNFLLENNHLSPIDIVSQSDYNILNQITPEQREKFITAIRTINDPAKLKADWQIAFLSPASINEMYKSRFKEALEGVYIGYLPIENLNYLIINELKIDTYNISDEKFEKLLTESKQKLIKSHHQNEQIWRINNSQFKWVKNITTKQFNHESLNRDTKFSIINHFQQNDLFTWSKLQKWQIQYLTERHLKQLMNKDIKVFDKIFPNLKEGQLEFLYQDKKLIEKLSKKTINNLTRTQVSKLIKNFSPSQIKMIKLSLLDKEFIKTCDLDIQKKLSWPQVKHVYTANSFFERLAQKIGAPFKLGFNLCLLPFELGINATYIILTTPLAIFSKTWGNKWKEKFSHSKKTIQKRVLPAIAIFSYSKYKWFEMHI